MIKSKIISLENLKKIKSKNKYKKIGLCHGVFDVVHFGHIEHLKFARKKVDILIVSVTADKFVNKAPHLPINNEKIRAKFLINFDFIDYVLINHKLTSENIIKILRPTYYFKGKDYLTKDITGNLNKELNILKKYKGKIIISKTKMMSSTKIVNNTLKNWSSSQKKILNYLSEKNVYENIYKNFEKIKKLEISIIGEPIIDEYIFGNMVGLTSKDPAISLLKNEQKILAGGAIAVCKMFSEFVKKVNIYTYGSNRVIKNFLKNYKNVKIINLSRKLKIQKKTRFLNATRFEKIMQISNIEKNEIDYKTTKKLIKRIKFDNPKNLVICDYGIDLFDKKFVEFIEKIKNKKFINVQSNSLNLGFNLFSKYNNYSYLSLDEKEWKLGFKKKSNILQNIITLSKIKKIPLSITKGKEGSNLIYLNKNYFCPTFIDKTVDTTGCGDAFFVITTLMNIIGCQKKLIPFIGNTYAGLHGQFFGNERIISKTLYLKYLKSILNF